MFHTLCKELTMNDKRMRDVLYDTDYLYYTPIHIH